MSIRWKLILWTVLPLVGVYTLIVAMDYRDLRATAYSRLESSVAERAEYHAATLDGQLSTMAQLARSTASFLSMHHELREEDLYELARSNLAQNPLVYGSCIAFEPGVYEGRERFAPYVHRAAEGIRGFDLSGSYDYAGGAWEWYRVPRETHSPSWTEPYFDDGAGDVVMCTYSAPFYRGGRLAGVATVDVRLEDLQGTVGPVGDEGGEFVILSRRGTVISHRDPSFIMVETVQSVADRYSRPDVAALGRRMIAGERGAERMPDLESGRMELVSFAPVPSAGWSFYASVPEETATGPVLRELRGRTASMAMGLVVIVGVVLIAGIRITNPVRQLAAAVGELSAGNLSARVRGVGGRDELGELATAFNSMVGQLGEHVEALTRETAAREAVESELRVARSIQASLLPRTFPPFPERTEFDLHAENAPARYVGGDFFDFFFVSEDVLAVLIADVSGKGVPAAMLMAVTRTIMRNLASGGATPVQALRTANRMLAEDNAEGMFVSLFIGQYETTTGRMRYANAGHPPPYLLDRAGGVRSFGQTTGTVLGVEREDTYEEREGRLEPGETLVFYTDGVTEARAPGGAFFGDAGLERLLSRSAGRAPAELCGLVLAALDEFQGAERHDDITVLALRRVR